MTDQKEIAGIFNDFLGLYNGKNPVGLQELLQKYKYHPVLLGLLSNMDSAAKIPVSRAMKDIYVSINYIETVTWRKRTEECNRHGSKVG